MQKLDKNLNKTQVIKILAIMLIIGLFITITVAPEKLKYPFSMKDVKVKSDKLDEINLQIIQHEQLLKDKQIEYSQALNEYNEKQKTNINSSFDMNNLKLHIPSILVLLEEEANKNELSLDIHYNEKQVVQGYSSGMPSPMPAEPMTTEPMTTEPMTTEPEVNSVEGVPNNEITVNSLDTEAKDDEVKINISDIQPLDGLNTLVLPVTIDGSYSGLREFINYLDDVDFIAPYSVDVETKGENVTGELILQIFYEGEF